MASAAARTRFADFSHADGDKIDFSTITGISGLVDVLRLATQAGSDTVIDFGAGDTLTLKNVAKSALVADDLYSLFLIESTGATQLVEIADTYSMYASGLSTAPSCGMRRRRHGGPVRRVDADRGGRIDQPYRVA